jgi:hypothetical protein
MIDELKGLYPGEKIYIVGKGPSLEYLDSSYFGVGPIITINESILLVQEFGLQNPIYAIRKDPCSRGIGLGHACPFICPHKDIVLILQSNWSEWCFPEHEKRVVVDPVLELGLKSQNEMSILMCFEIAKRMGCVKFGFVCCDSFIDDNRVYDMLSRQSIADRRSGYYEYARNKLLPLLINIPHEFIIPKEYDDN